MTSPLRIEVPSGILSNERISVRTDSLHSDSSAGSPTGSCLVSPFAAPQQLDDPGSPPTPMSPAAFRSLYPMTELGSRKEGQASRPPSPSPVRRSKNDIFSQNWRVSAPHVRPAPPVPKAPDLQLDDEPGWPGSRSVSAPSFTLAPPPVGIQRRPSPQGADAFVADLREPSQLSQQDLRPPQRAPDAGKDPPRLPQPVVPPSSSVLLRLHPNRRHLLGEGSHASVYLASFKSASPGAAGARWRLCAAKRPGPDSVDNAANLREAAILRRLGSYTGSRDGGSRGEWDHCPWIINLFAVKDERDSGAGGLETSSDLENGEDSSGRSSPVALLSSGATTPGHRAAKSLDGGSVSRSASIDKSLVSDVTFGVVPATPAAVAKGTTGESYSYFPDPSPSGTTHSSPRPFLRRGSSLADLDRSKDDDRTPFAVEPSVDPPRLVLLLEYCPGGTLFDFVKSSPERVGRGRWSGWARQLCSAVAWCTRHGVVIGDLKPQNVLLAEDLTLRLADFNRSIILSPTAPLPTDPLGIGTSAYSPPELVRSAPSPFGFPADVFSLGVTLCVALTGREPFQSVRSPIERMMWATRGGFWEWEERQRFDRDAGSQPPSRAGSIRRHVSGTASVGTPQQQQRRRERQSSAASRVSELGSSAGPGMSTSPPQAQRSFLETQLLNERLLDVSAARGASKIGQRAIEGLLQEGDSQDEEMLDYGSVGGSIDVSRRSSINSISSRSSTRTSMGDASFSHFANPPWPDDPDPAPPDGDDIPLTARYSDGTPLQWYLDGRHIVSEGVRWLLKRMCEPEAAHRPTVAEVLETLGILFPGAFV